MVKYIEQMKKTLLILFISISTFASWGQEVLIEQYRKQIPVLKHKALSPVLQFTAIDSGSNEHRAKKLIIEFEGTTNINDIDSVFLINMQQDSSWHEYNGNIITGVSLKENDAVFTFSTPLNLVGCYFLVAVRLTDTASLKHKISTGIKRIEFSEARPKVIEADAQRIKQRIGESLRNGGDDGVVRYRIPGIASTTKNSLLAIYDVRRDNGRDLQGNIDIGVSRSIDGGNSWEPMRIALDMEEYGNMPQNFNGVSDACILVDKKSNDIYIAGCWMHGVIDEQAGLPVTNLTEESNIWNHQWRNNGSLQGFDINRTSQFIIAKSTDDGKTWNEPMNITKQVKKHEWHLFAPAPGSGITLNDGTLVFPTQGKDKNQHPFSNIIYSKNGGQTWHSSNPSYSNTTENMVVQLNDGSIMQNMRDNRNASNKSNSNGRAVFVTNSFGEKWTEYPTHHNKLIEPVCMASLYKHTYITNSGDQNSILLFSNPNSKYKREKMTIKISLDDGKTWPEEYWLLLDEMELSGGYSSITSINNNTIGILYEGSQAQMTFESIGLDEFRINDYVAH